MIIRLSKYNFISLGTLNGLKQEPKDTDFSITPVLKFGWIPKHQGYVMLNKGFAIGVEWGHWALVLQCFQTKREECNVLCTGCEWEFDIKVAESDSDDNWFCPECWKELAPVMRAEYQELLDKGEIEKYED